jgi:galactose mutarotase-like enzyme
MISKLTNEYLTIEVKSFGAELCSIKSNSDGTEYLWQADKEYWGRSAPVLFPIVGKLVDDKYIYNNNTYNLSQHGFARDMEFQITAAAPHKITGVIESSQATLNKYPFKFQLQIDYELKGRTLSVEYTVRNTGNDMMYFSIGAHPGFNCPINNSEKMEDYYLEFECDENISSYCLEEGGISRNTKPFLNNEKIVKLSPDLFREDAIILKGLKSNKLSMRSKASNKAVTVEFTGFPYLGIWSKPEGAPFLCIEPWYGIADYVDFTGDITVKEGILSLKPSCEFNCQYSIVIEE